MLLNGKYVTVFGVLSTIAFVSLSIVTLSSYDSYSLKVFTCKDVRPPPVKYASCKWSSSYAMDCTYDTICFDGVTTFVVVGETDEEVKEFMKDDPFNSRHYDSDGTYWRRPLDVVLDMFENSSILQQQVRPYLRVEQYVGVNRSFVDNANATWLADDTYFINPGNNYPHTYADLYTVAPVWNAIYDMMTALFDAVLAVAPGTPSFTLRSSIWPKEDGKMLQCSRNNAEKANLTSSRTRVVCGHNAHQTGFSYVPLTGALSRRKLKSAILGVLGAPTKDNGQESLGKDENIVVAVVDRYGEPRRFTDVHAIIQSVREAVKGRQTGVTIDHVPALQNLKTVDQIHVFANADVVVMAHGAGLAHSVWMKPNSALIEIIPYGWNSRSYRELYSGSGGYYQDVLAIPMFNGTNMSAKLIADANECASNAANWEESYFYFQSACYNEVYKHASVSVDPNDLEGALRRAYKHLARKF
eukprot:CFRG7699T1